MEANDKTKKKIENLFKKAESAQEIGSLEEAQLFINKANQLLVKYNLEQVDVMTKETGNTCIGEEVMTGEIHGWNKTDSLWVNKLYARVAKYNFCDAVFSMPYWIYDYGEDGIRTPNKKKWVKPYVTIIGEPHNIEMVKYICSHIIPKLKKLQSKRWKELQGQISEKKNTFKRGYFSGAVMGIANKLYDQQKTNEKKYEGLPGLIKLNEVAVKEKTDEIFPELGRTRSRGLSGVTGAAVGRKDGRNMNINKGISNNSGLNTGHLLN